MAFSLITGARPDGSFAGLLDSWVEHKVHSGEWRRTTATFAAIALPRWKALLGDRPIISLGPADIQRLYETLAARGSPSWLNLQRSKFRCFWRWALALELVKRDLVRAWPRRRQLRRRVYLCLGEREETRLAQALKPRFARYLRFALRTGLRYGEIRALRWGWFWRGEEGWMATVAAEHRKQGIDCHYPILDSAMRALGRRGGPEDLVFPNLPGRSSIGKALKSGARRAGLSDRVARYLSPHQLRRTFVGRLQRRGVANSVIRLLGGWESEEVLDRHYTPPLSEHEARRYLRLL